jgi:hypothetical protein
MAKYGVAIFMLLLVAGVSAAPEGLSLPDKASMKQKPFVLFTPRAVSDTLWPDNVFPSGAPAGDTLHAMVCRGEYEPFTALVYALEPALSLEVAVGGLKSGSGVIPPDSIDVRVVKCWFKAAGYFPELLLRDDSLVLVDTVKKQDRLRSTAADGTKKYAVCSDAAGEGLADVRPLDAAQLRPVTMAKNSLKQFWFTLHAPDDAPAGIYKGKITFKSRGAKLAVPLVVTVCAFDLQPAGLTYSLYYRGALSADQRPAISSEVKNEEQYRAEMADLKAHGVLFPTSGQEYNERLLGKALEIRKETGLPAGTFFNLGGGLGSDTNGTAFTLLAQWVGQWIDFVKPYGYDRVFFYGDTGAAGQGRALKAVQDAGGKTFAACGPGDRESLGALLNCAVLSGTPAPEQAQRWHAVGSQVFCCAYPQAGEIVPETYRRHFGLELWKAGFDGAMDFAYQYGSGHLWNDFDGDSSGSGDRCFAYPTINGVVPTLQWEGFREAVDDIRYVTTLERAISSAGPAKKERTDKALAWLNSLDPRTADLCKTRAEMAEWISKLMN